MSLPTRSTPIYTLELPSTKKKFKYRPFLVKDEKSLMIAQQSENPIVMLDTVKDIIKACSKCDIDVDSLPSFDIEYIFLQMRAVSIGDIVELLFKCDTCEDENAVAQVQINLNDVKVKFDKEHSTKIPLYNDVGIVMKYPTVNVLKKNEHVNLENVDEIFNAIVDCVDYIYDSEQLYKAEDQPREEIVKFISELTTAEANKIEQFFWTMPSLRIDVNYTCPVCNRVHNKYMEGLSSFF